MADNYVVSSAAINWFDSDHALNIHVFTSDGDTVTERYISTSSGGWKQGDFSQSGSGVSATVWTTSAGASIRVYVTNQGAVTEWCKDPGGTWYQGTYA